MDDRAWRQWEIAMVPPLYRGAKLSDFPNIEVRLNKSTYISGLNGRGKTHLAAAMAMEVAKMGGKTRFITSTMYLKRIRASFSKRGKKEMEVFEEMLLPDVLVFDDVGAEKIGDFGLSEVLALLSERDVWNKVNYVTSNKTLTELHALEPRLASRLGAYQHIRLEGEDRRLQGE